MRAPAALVGSLRAAALDTLRPLIDPRRPVALLDFPAYGNVGDSAIWLGTLAALRALGVRPPVYTCDVATYDRDRMRRALGDGTILLSGGGNLGDLWEPYQRLRETVIADFPERPIVQLPQSIYFRRPSALAQARASFDRHSSLTLLVRERQSLELAHASFRAPAVLCPDLAAVLGPLPHRATTEVSIRWLGRRDQELAHPPEALPPGVQGDWTEDPDCALLALNRRMSRLLARRRVPGLRALVSATYAPLARRRLARGCRLLASASVVVTDRLHGHLLALALGVPHVLLNNRYGKVKSFHETWTAGAAGVHWAESAVEAWQIATRIAEGTAPG